jgi:membrane protease YdiL (CAAX protease family)
MLTIVIVAPAEELLYRGYAIARLSGAVTPTLAGQTLVFDGARRDPEPR